jgi:hypothetical protein
MAAFIFYLPLFVLVPTLVGLYRFKTLDDGHRFFLYYLVVYGFFQVTSVIIVEINVKTKMHYANYGICFFLLFQTLSHWIQSFRWKMLFKIISIIAPLTIFIEFALRSSVINIPSYSKLFISFFFSIVAIPLLVKKFSHGTLVPWENSIVLILIPLIITLLIAVVLHVVYAVVYSSFTHPFLSRSFFVLRILQFLSYFSFTIAMLWAPRKEIFI